MTPPDAPRADAAEGVAFGDGHEHDWEPGGMHAWVCSRCGCWTHHPPLSVRAVDAYEAGGRG